MAIRRVVVYYAWVAHAFSAEIECRHCMYICMYVCMYIRTYVCTNVCMHVRNECMIASVCIFGLLNFSKIRRLIQGVWSHFRFISNIRLVIL